VQEPQKPLAQPIIPALWPAICDQARVLQVLKKAMRRRNRQIAAFSDLGNTPSIYRCSDALQRAEVAFQRGSAFADQLGLLAKPSKAFLTRTLRKSSLSNNQEFFPLFEKMEIDPC
jgi:hypothetical protein